MAKLFVKVNYRSLALLVALIILVVSIKEILKHSFISDSIFTEIITLILVLAIVYYLLNVVDIDIKNWKHKNIESEIKKMKNFIRIFLFVVFILYIVVLSTKDPILGVASGTVVGLVFGLALQPILSNLFSGLIILITGYIKVGDKIRILLSQIPYQASTWPAYKFFSEDVIPIGYKGYVEEIGIFYTKLMLVSGVRLKVPNSIILSSGIIEKESLEQSRLIKVRFEFPIRKIEDFEEFLKSVENKIRNIKGIERVSVTYSEQSDKENVIIEVKVDAKTQEHKQVKSLILKELMKIWKKINMEERAEKHDDNINVYKE